jgi:hypothetical protein
VVVEIEDGEGRGERRGEGRRVARPAVRREDVPRVVAQPGAGVGGRGRVAARCDEDEGEDSDGRS